MPAPIRFDRFMEKALHDPQTGYYARRIKSVGRRGDFTTAPMISQALARAIAAWAARALKESRTRHLIEIGPGEGRLALAVRRHLPWLLRQRVRLHLVETSLPLARRQRELLGSHAVWHTHPASALAACDGNAVIYSNELVDAFPVRRFQKTAAGWKEIAIRTDPPEEILIEPEALPDSTSFLEPHPPGQRIEVHESYHNWLAEWLPHWKSGRMLTIDYGAAAARLYHRRPGGTLRSYLFHQLGEGMAVYENPGRQDITADVNFTDLIHWTAAVAGSRLHPLASFISGFADPANPADTYLTNEEGAGAAFLVLDQKRL